MRILALDCATAACSVALFEDGHVVAARLEQIGRGHAERLVPLLAQLPGQGRADRLLVSLGPGSFTGVRIGLAAARALGLAWNRPVLGYPTLALVAAMARRSIPAAPVTVCMQGGHGEFFVQDFDRAGMPCGPLASLGPAALAQRNCQRVIAGNAAARLAELVAPNQRAGAPLVLDLLPDAAHALLVSEALLRPEPSPLYGRAPDARVPESIAAAPPAGGESGVRG